MDNRVLFGNLNEKSFPLLLFELWNSKKTGRLTLKVDPEEIHVYFEKGSIVFTSDNFPEDGFLSSLAEKREIDPAVVQELSARAKEDEQSMIKTVVREGVLPAPSLWQEMKDYAIARLSSHFDGENTTFVFQPENKPKHLHILFRLPTVEVLLQGLRNLANPIFLADQFPEKGGDVRMLYPQHQSQISLLPHEEYLLHILLNLKNTTSVIDHSELGREETQKILFLFLCLGFFHFSKKSHSPSTLTDFSHKELDGLLSSFNKKWLFIFKYISKELGPVALNILGKSLEEAKTRVSPLFQSVKLQPNGQIDTQSVLKAKYNFSSQDIKQALLIGLNEIIVAEVMAVKKTLGDEHEAILVHNLQRMDG